MINTKGKIEKYYDKIHMFDVNLSKREKHLESNSYSKGNKIEVVDLPWGKLGMSICYDIRFPNMYRCMSKLGDQIYFCYLQHSPSQLGKKH